MAQHHLNVRGGICMHICSVMPKARDPLAYNYSLLACYSLCIEDQHRNMVVSTVTTSSSPPVTAVPTLTLSGGVPHHPSLAGLWRDERLTDFAVMCVGDVCSSVGGGNWENVRPDLKRGLCVWGRKTLGR